MIRASSLVTRRASRNEMNATRSFVRKRKTRMRCVRGVTYRYIGVVKLDADSWKLVSERTRVRKRGHGESKKGRRRLAKKEEEEENVEIGEER